MKATKASPRRKAVGKPSESGSISPPKTGPIFDASNIQLQRRMRFNPLRTLDPENLSIALDQFDIGILRQAALLWDAMARRDDTLSFVKPQLENAVAGKPWGVFKQKNADETEAKRHAACLEYFWNNVTATDAFDRNQRGSRHMLLKQMGSAHATMYAAHHFVWKPEPGKMIEVEDAEPVPALSAELEFVPLWFFENVTGTLRCLPFGGFGIDGTPLNWDGEWICTTGQGIMFAAAICYTFKRMTCQDWTIFNERYAQQKVVGQTNAKKGSEPGNAMEAIVQQFNSDMGIVLFECQAGEEAPIKLLGPEGTVSVDLFERFLDRQDRKMTVMFRGSDLRNMSREKETTGVSAQSDETESMELAHCRNIADSCRQIDRQVIKYCFGEGVEPLAYFSLPELEREDAKTLRENAGFLADRGVLVEADTVAERLGVTVTDDPALALQSIGAQTTPPEDDETAPDGEPGKTANAGTRKKEQVRLQRLRQIVEDTLRTRNMNDRHDAKGRFASGPDAGGGSGGSDDPQAAVGKSGDWKTLGLGSVTAFSPDTAMEETPVGEARERLGAGFTAPTVLGDKVSFGQPVLDHWTAKAKTQADMDGRLRHLDRAVAALKTPHEVWENEHTGTKTFIHVVRGADKQRVVNAFTLQDGAVESYYATSNLRRKGDQHREGKLLYVR